MMINDSMIYVRWMLYVNTLYIIPYHVYIYIYDHQVLNCPDVKWSFSLWLFFYPYVSFSMDPATAATPRLAPGSVLAGSKDEVTWWMVLA